ncbi:class I SAM-dependent methyltransferase [Mycobacterium sp. CBMA271]|uniref:class I SAM-dependent methyltransferase n=1 Tax=unclassified Mycobacteroides TaxID=2618759 RepID=UPI0012DE0473|nr:MULTISPECIES: class I SAM-dependent methyltransferase [unclassified Mycobacteroides]MUM17204.1 methyltransferase type 11 [Mycobacteroides sp. CBMA 326]MUM23966.1 class I SAM-dependent methyltransferase [Mycobacteroides sp. CBMA 271]
MDDDLDALPRAGFDASWLARRLQTDKLEYLDRDDVPDKKRAVVHGLERMGHRLGYHKKNARLAAELLPEVTNPRVLELGAAHGGLSRELLQLRPDAHITVTDIEPSSVEEMAASDLATDDRVTVRPMDATAIDTPDNAFDLAVFALSFHHLPPRLASKVFAEGTRAAKTLLIIDIRRLPAPLLAIWSPFGWAQGTYSPCAHDGHISYLRAYGTSALRTLAAHADPSIQVQLRTVPAWPTPMQVVVARRA